MFFGWNYWNLGVEDEELEEAKDRAAEKNKEEKKEEKEKEKEKDKKEKGLKTIRCSGTNSSGDRCSLTTDTTAKTWKCSHHMDFTDGMDRDGDGIKEYRCAFIKSNGEQCKMKGEYGKKKRCYHHVDK